jgi:para-nitrobenzyl esterase
MAAIVETGLGRLRGIEQGGVRVFRGIPFAKPPVGTLRFRAPQKWLAFARTGDPSHAGLPAWPRYEPARRATMELGRACKVLADPGADERRVWEGLL